ncbi:amidohydrolase family protein [Micromonospora sp. NPDC051925]|uniref:amidohydrolase family protein n=1 Tax=Micromonospora sp. NPDC051925 TaxID=3364288 RepID=UPI0037C5950E
MSQTENVGSPEQLPGISRRSVIRRSSQVLLGGGAALLAGGPAAGGTPARAATPAGTQVTLHEASGLAVTLSPDGRTLVMDALNVLWAVPAAGGPGRRLTEDIQEAAQPHFSPDGRRVVFQSYREGTYDLWTINADGTGLRRLTSGPGYDESPRWSPDGQYVAFSSDRGNASHIWLLRPADGTVRVLTSGDHRHSMPTWSADGTRVVYVRDDTSIQSHDIGTGTVEQLAAATGFAALYGPSVSPGGRHLSYVSVDGPKATLIVDGRVVSDGADVSPTTAAWADENTILYHADGRIQRRELGGDVVTVPFAVTVPVARRTRAFVARDHTAGGDRAVKGICGPVLSPDGRRVAFRALNALWLLPVGGTPRRIVDDGYFTTDPDWAPDGRSLVYVSDRAGTANLWRFDLATGLSTRVTDLPDGQLRPRWSPDGTRIAYQDEKDATWVLDVDTGVVRQVLPALYQPGRPTWSPDGTVIALAASRPYSRRGRFGHNHIVTVDLRTGTIRYQAPAPERSLSTRGEDGPVWTRDGRHLLVSMESLAWRIPVAPDGTVTGAPVQVSSEVTDSLSVSADSRTLLYLNNGRLRTVDLAGGGVRTVPTGLTWRPRRPAGRLVVRAGAIWDGTSGHLRHDVDIEVAGDRIVRVRPGGSGSGDRVVDARHLTVMPGLIDTHCHWHWRGKQWGDRQGRAWLAYGVTTSRSPGDPAYQMVENREAIAAGLRVGPRYFGTGEALDGSRTYHYVMRPTFTVEQLDRELDRVSALEYDILKSYMTLPQSFERHAVRRAQAEGRPVTSHYLYPAAHTGLSGMEHTGGGSRLGYSRTLSYGAGLTSEDSVALLAASGMWISSTTLFATELYADDRSLVEDERTRVLFPEWDYRRLQAKADDAASGPSAELNQAWTKGDVDMLLRVHRAGGLVVAGTDAALDDIGISMHQNLRAMVKYGFTPAEALTTATVNAARGIGMAGRLGVIAPGHLADLSFVAGDPLRDIAAAAAVRQVMTGGVLHTVPELMAPFRAATAPAAVRANRVGPAARSARADEQHYWHHSESDVHGCCRAR